MLEQRRLDDRLIELAIDAPGVGRTPLRLLLPAGFDADPGRRWPVLYLLHGGDGDFTDWTDGSQVEEMTSALDVIVAMPDSGRGATYVDWAYDGPNGRPQYETWITELLPDLLSREFRADDRAVIAGLSAGGFGAMSYAARHPDRYRAVATFSGNLDTRDGDRIGPWLSAVPTLALDHAFPLGDPLTQEVRWRGHNPLDLVPNLAGVDMFVSNGNGQIGELSGPLEFTDFLWLESSTERRSRAFVARAAELGITVTTDFYGNGTHSFPWWNRELGRAMPMLMATLDRERPAPDSFTYRSVEPRFSVWDWTFEISDRADLAFTDVTIDGDELSVSGNGTLRVTTPPNFVRGGRAPGGRRGGHRGCRRPHHLRRGPARQRRVVLVRRRPTRATTDRSCRSGRHPRGGLTASRPHQTTHRCPGPRRRRCGLCRVPVQASSGGSAIVGSADATCSAMTVRVDSNATSHNSAAATPMQMPAIVSVAQWAAR